jgi:hypothetical protein
MRRPHHDGGPDTAPAKSKLLAGAALFLAVVGVIALIAAAISGPDLPPAPALTSGRSHAPVSPTGPGSSVSPSAPSTTGPADPAPTATPAVVQPLKPSVPVHIAIRALHLDTRLIRLGQQADGSVAVPIGPRPVGWYTGSPTPGQRGPSVIAAHVTWNGARGAFWALGQMRPGQRITIRRADAKTVTFEVTRVAVYQKSSFPTSVVYGNTADPELRLITCAGDYHPGTAEPYAANVVVYAEAVARSS